MSVWRSDGRHSAGLFGPRPQWRARAIAAGTGGLWAVSAEDRGGTLWHSTDGTDWRAIAALPHGKPEALAVTADRAYVTGAGAVGRGIPRGPGGEPARSLSVPLGQLHRGRGGGSPDQIEYEDQDPSVYDLYEAECAKNGVEVVLPRPEYRRA